jgi:dTDP-4-amino-4,6-dideoxy-D-galactose acyltransferase
MNEGAGTSAGVEVLHWDSEFFGFPVARISLARPEAHDLDTAIRACRSEGIRCAYLLCPVDAASTITAAVRRGFRLVDLRVTLSATLPVVTTVSTARDVRPEDVPALRLMARTGFPRSRFFVDGRFDRSRVEDLFQVWLERDLDEGVAVVSDREGRPAGFATARVDRDRAMVGLVGVAPEFRGTGVGRDVTGALLAKLGERVEHVQVVTQASNYAATALYEGIGFRSVAVEGWLHWWLDENAV